ncbi:carbohydrate-binding protein [Flavobacterium sp. UMI-01]|uniref:carbohydrate-binding protein n=1 Tax=Flavobacterium sp. UMI-01 TaxID=1441053 RepID=UPI001C7D2E1C|nr:carbohydrate-binding protein [Flavobacterium sp. UMI-01]GIZ09761.1 hypothetical protein FUMI01_24880 [Flavobacterium sp. UMI-01]
MKTKITMLKTNEFYSLSKKWFLIFLFSLLTPFCASAITVTSIAGLVAAAKNSNQTINMTAGTYYMADYLTPAVISATVPDAIGRAAMINFSGSNNTFNLTGVTIIVDTALLNDFGKPVMELSISGNYITVNGLTITDIGTSPTHNGGQSVAVDGNNCNINDVTLNVAGSSPYGYGDLLGKGSPNLVSMKKHSGMLISGINDNITRCTIISAAFGHLFFIQGGQNAVFTDCYAEAVTRTTASMLAETSGTAYNLGFASVYANYNGDKVITTGYTKSLSECGYRTYGSGGVNGNTTGAISFINCKAKNVRSGFALNETNGDISLVNCEAIGCEAGFNVADGVTVTSSRGDAVNGPLLFAEGTATTVELELIPTLNTTTLHAIACIAGTGHNVKLTKYQGTKRSVNSPILIGSTAGAGTNPFSPFGSAVTTGVTLNNYTGMPVTVGSNVSSSFIGSDGVITNNGASNNLSIHTEAESYSSMSGVQTQTTTDTDGGLNVSHIDTGDYMNYSITIPTAGTYFIDYRLASLATAGKINFYVNGTNKKATPLPVSGGWQTWTNKTTSGIAFTPGTYSIKVEAAIGGFNLNWFKLTTLNPVSAKFLVDREKIASETEDLTIYPNPVTDLLRIANSENANVQLSDSLGRIILTQKMSSNSESIDMSKMGSGIYFVKIDTGEKVITKKIIKK